MKYQTLNPNLGVRSYIRPMFNSNPTVLKKWESIIIPWEIKNLKEAVRTGDHYNIAKMHLKNRLKEYEKFSN